MGISISNQLLGSTGLSVGLGLSRGNGLSFGGFAGGPALYLPFALTGTLDSRITFSRASQATMYDSTGKLTYAPNNLLTYSNDFSNAAWTKTGLTQSAGLVTTSAGSSWHRLSAAPALRTAIATTQIKLKAGTHRYVQILDDGAAVSTDYANFDLVAGTLSSGGVSATISDAGDGYWLCSITGGSDPNNNGIFISPVTGLGAARAESWNAAGTETFHVKEAQFEYVTYETSPRTYNATTASAYYGPRFDYNPATLVAQGLLIEEARTNTCKYSKTNVTNWTPGSVSVGENNATSPDGTTSATLLTTTATNSAFYYSPSFTTTAAAWTQSFFAKAGTASWIYIRPADNDTINVAWFNLSSGAVGTTGTGVTSTITSVGNGWYRCTVTKTVASGTGYSVIGIASGDNTLNCASGVTAYVWGSQAEAGSFATSYIPTAAASVTRAGDAASMTGTNFSSWFNQSEGTFVAGFSTPVYTATSQRVLHFDLASTSTPLFILSSTQISSYNGSAIVATSSGLSLSSNNKAGFAYTNGVSSSIAINNNSVVAAAVDYNTGTPTLIDIGSYNAGASFLNGHIQSITYYNTRLPNATLQSLTLPVIADYYFLVTAGGDQLTDASGNPLYTQPLYL